MNRMVCKIINLSVPKLGVLCALAGVNPRVRAFQINAKFARAAQNLSYSSTEFAEFINLSLRPPRLGGEFSLVK